MDELIATFPDQIQEALQIGRGADVQISGEIRNVLITGLGGSGIGGTIAAGLLADSLTVPVTVNNDYTIPNWVNKHTLVIANSYSGNTEETLCALDLAIARNAQIVCITSGGKMVEVAVKNDLGLIVIPGGRPPRSALAYSLVQQLFVLLKAGLAHADFETGLERSVEQLRANATSIQGRAQEIAEQLHGRTTVIYAGSGYEGIAVRLRQQINENAKALCWHHILPEMNHNELVGWAGGSNDYAVVMFRNEDDYNRTQTRMNISKAIFANHCDTVIEVHGKGADKIERSMYLIHLGDWVSEYLAQIKGVDSVEVNVIDYLKGELAKL